MLAAVRRGNPTAAYFLLLQHNTPTIAEAVRIVYPDGRCPAPVFDALADALDVIGRGDAER